MPTQRWDTPIPTVPDRFVYRLRPCNGGSDRYGPCEVCGKYVAHTHIQVEGRTFEYDGLIMVTRYETTTLFGHPECLLGKRC